MRRVIVKAVSQIDLAIFYESVDGTFSLIDRLDSFDAWERQVGLILHLAQKQGTDEPEMELEIGGDYY
ncbi:hypothetical protein [Lactococcus lactis]|uniref:hypothetical protein n=1 Tax=Lactococcus lactis TaxID=1358 RepID=UPI0022E0F031|nr:hypothetical protein [Lactococcus lactis]